MINKNIVLFILVGIISIWLGFFAFDNVTMLEYYKNSIYWILTLNIIIWLISVFKSKFNEDLKNKEYKNITSRFSNFIKNHWFAFIVSLVLMTLGYNFYEPEFRIFGDETNLLSDSQNLYEAQKCFSTHSQLEFSNGGKIILAGVLDKRPALFPYLVSIIHSLTSYRPENVFYFNYTIGFLSLFLTYYLIQLFWGKYWGINGLIYLASYPLFIKYTYSGGFEVFNLFCSLILFIIIYEFIKYPESLKAESLLLFIPLISQSRYESVFSLFITLPLVFYLLPIKEYSKLSYKFLYVSSFFNSTSLAKSNHK